MNAVGKVGTFFAQSVYTVSGPFHPFGGAVDIIVVQQEDGTFRSSPWYVKFGKFQGVLKRREKKVVVAVNDGDANFHMYLDHKGEAYFLKDAPGEEVATFSPPEAVSSGDENSSHMLALEYPRAEAGAKPRAEQLGKEESEDEKGDDLELRFEGRDASKQLIQQSADEGVTTAGIAAQGNSVKSPEELGILESGPRAEEVLSSFNQDHPTSSQPKAASEAGRRKTESSNGKIMHALLNKAVGLEAGVKSTPASAILANAALVALQSQSSSSPDNIDISPKEESSKAAATEVRTTPSKNGIIIHGLLNQAIGLEPSHRSGPVIGLIASAILASLHKAVSDSQSQDGASLKTPHAVELDEGVMDVEKSHEDTGTGSPVGKLTEEQNPVLDSASNPNAAIPAAAAGPFTSNGNTSADDVTVMNAVSSLGSSSGLSDQSDVEAPISPSRTSQFFDVKKTLEVMKLEILDTTLVVEVQEHVEKDKSFGSVGSEEQKDISDAEGRVESIVVDRKKVMEKVHDLQGSSGQDGPVGGTSSEDPDKLVSAQEQDVIPEDVGKLVTVHVDKRFVKNLQDALAQNTEGGPTMILEKEKVISAADEEVAIINSRNGQAVRSLGVTVPGKELPINGGEHPATTSDDVRDNSTQDSPTPGQELALLNAVLPEASSPRMKAAIELEMAWREVMDKAATTLKLAPYTSKKLNHSQSYKKKGLENGEKHSDSPGRLPQQSERKTWGGWLWGGSSAPQAKTPGQPSSSKDGKDVLQELGGNGTELDSELRDPYGVTSESEDVSKSGTHAMNAEGNVETEEKAAQSESDSGQTEVRKSGVANGKPQDQLDFSSDVKGQQKVADGLPPRRRSLFGLLSRTNTNQSSLSSASSLQSNDDLQPMLDGLKRETSLERAENVVVLLEETWAKGSEARRARVEDTRMAKLQQESKVDREILEGRSAGHGRTQGLDGNLNSETFEGSRAGAALKRVEGTSKVLASADPEDDLKGDDSSHSHDSSSLEATGLEMAGVQLEVTPDENSGVSTTKSDAEDAGKIQQVTKVSTNGPDRDTTTTSSVSDNNNGDLTSTLDMDLLLMSVDGHLVRAPLGLGNDEAPPSVDNGEKMKKSGCPPQKLVCFAGVSDDEMPSSSADTHNLARNTVQQGMGTQIFESLSDESDRHLLVESNDGKPANPGCEGLKGLAKLVEYDSVGAAQHNMCSSYSHNSKHLPIETPPEQLGTHSERGETLEVNGHDESGIDGAEVNEFDDMRAMVFEKLEEDNDGDALDPDKERAERYYSSKDLTEAEDEEEKKDGNSALKRNLSVYMDAISGEDEQDSSGSAHEDDLNQSRDKSGPIGIPGAQNWAQNFSSGKEHMSRSVSESLPIARNILVNSDAVSPRLTLSRSLDSASPPSILSPAMREQNASSDSVLTTRPSARSPLKSLAKAGVEVSVVDSTPEKVKGESEQLSGGMYISGTQTSTTANSSSNKDDGDKGPETGFELSLCRHLLKERMGLEAAAKVFSSERVTLEEFKNSGSAIAANDKLVVRVGGRYYPWMVAAPIVLGILAFGQVLIAPNEGAIAVEQPIVVFDGKAASNASTSSGGGWKIWPFGGIRRPKTPERALLSRELMMVATEAALKSSVRQEYLRMAGYYKRPRKVRTNSPSSQQLASLNLKEGSNKITFTFETRVWGKQQVDARIYLWKWSTRIVISDVDGTITKSDVLGQVMPLMGRDWTQIGVARLFSAIKKNGYEVLFLSARAISQAYLTRQFLENIKQDGEALPDGPMVISPDGLFPSLYREVIRRAPHEFKIACLEDIKSLFPPETKPFYAGFGNRDTDELSYLKVGISKGKIFIINPKGEVVVNNQVDVKSYTSLHKLVDDMFPAMTFTEQEDYNEWNFWKLPLPDIDDEPSVTSVGSSSSRRSGKSGRLS
ncbi:unnamed protein product [Calypogeia fissa]